MTAVTSFGERSSSRLLTSVVRIKRHELITKTEVTHSSISTNTTFEIDGYLNIRSLSVVVSK